MEQAHVRGVGCYSQASLRRRLNVSGNGAYVRKVT
jgi:hypothetical protein